MPEFLTKVDEPQQDGELVGGGKATLVQEDEEPLSEADGIAVLGVRRYSSQYAARSGITRRTPPRGSGTSPS
jgi:hypothetical protein